MVHIEAISWVNTVFPLSALVLLALILPRYLVDRTTRSHLKVAKGIAIATAFMFFAGGVISMALAQMRGFDPEQHLLQYPMEALKIHGRLSAMSALIWAPVLLLVWVGHAQGVEARRNRDMIREGMSDQEGVQE
ncbi:hypothetical protein [Thalassovita aquimarina]|uniref:hypothetical protein n=1 Tax=Thalassovita aquimarina TaxID=2785917 RepID=UPI0035686E5C